MRTRPLLAVAALALVAGCGQTGTPAVQPVATVHVPRVTAAPGASVAWLAGGPLMRGVTPDGRSLTLRGAPLVNGRVGGPGLRSADGAYLYVQSSGRLQVAGAVDGKIVQTVDLPSDWTPNAGFASVSAGGRWLGLAVEGGSTVRLLLIDLTQGRVVASGAIARPSAARLGPARIGLLTLPDGRLLVLAPTRILLVGLRGQRLGVVTQAAEPRLFCDSATTAQMHLALDGRTLIGYCPFDGSVWWFDLTRFRISAQLPMSLGNPFWGAPAFAPDDSRLFIYDGWDGQVNVVDLTQHRLVRAVQVFPRRSSFHLPFVQDALAKGPNFAAALSPDGGTLFVAGPSGEGGLFALDAESLTVKARWLEGHTLQAVWVSGEGLTVYGVELRGRTSFVDVLDPGSGAVRNPAAADAVFDFAVS